MAESLSMFSMIENIIIPEGKVISIKSGDVTLWKTSTSRIPSIYQEVEYLAADGSAGCYIDLGFTFDTKAAIHLKQYISDTTVSAYPFGATEKSGSIRCCLSSPYSGGATIYGSTGSGYISTASKIQVGWNIFVIQIEEAYLYIQNNIPEGNAKSIKTQGVYTMTNNLYLFAQNYNGSPRFGATRQISVFRYYDKNDKLICDLVPCYRKSDGVPGMYDRIARRFLTNAGSGSFIVGPAVDAGDIGYTNIISNATDDNGKIYNIIGYRDGVRWSMSSNAETNYTGGRITGWIPFNSGATYRIKNFSMNTSVYVAHGYILLKMKDGTVECYPVANTMFGTWNNTYNVETDLWTLTYTNPNVESFRISAYSNIAVPIITCNEEIV